MGCHCQKPRKSEITKKNSVFKAPEDARTASQSRMCFEESGRKQLAEVAEIILHEKSPALAEESALDNPRFFGPQVAPSPSAQKLAGDAQLKTEDDWEATGNKRNDLQTPAYFKEEFLSGLIGRVHELIRSPRELFECIYEEKKKEHGLKIYLHSYISTQKFRVNIFRSEFYVKCTPQFFLQFQNNIEEQKRLDQYHEDYKPLAKLDDSTGVIYLSYRKNILFNKRDFVYLKHFRQLKDFSPELWVDGSLSVGLNDNSVYCQPHPDVVRGDINYSGYLVQSAGDNLSYVRTRSEVDFKSSVPLILTKTFSVKETRKYIDCLTARIEKLAL